MIKAQLLVIVKNSFKYFFFLHVRMKSRLLSFLLVILLFLSGCSVESFDGLEQSVALANEIPSISMDAIIIKDGSATYNFGNSPLYTDSLVLTEKNDHIEQVRRITFTGRVPNSLLLDLPKSFAENTDQISVVIMNSGEELEWNVIEFDPVIEIINLKEKELNGPIDIQSTITLLGAEGLDKVMYREARRHQLRNIIANADTGKKQEDFFLLGLMQHFPEQFDVDDCTGLSTDRYELVCQAMLARDGSVCEYGDSEKRLWCKRMVMYTEINRFPEPLSEQHEQYVYDFMKEYDVADCSKLVSYKEECEERFAAAVREDSNEEKKSKDKSNEEFDVEKEYDYNTMFENPEDACEQINLGYEIQKALFMGNDLYCVYYEEDVGLVDITVDPFRTGKSALNQWTRFTNPENPENLRVESLNNDDPEEPQITVQELYKNTKIRASGSAKMAYNGLVDNTKDYVDSILPEYELKD
jgi:hypothetical protein